MSFKGWPSTVSEGDWKRLEIIKGIFVQDPEMVGWLFRSNKPEIFADPETVMKEAGAFSSGQKILIQVALAVWCWYECANIVDICRRLDGKNFQAVMNAMIELRKI